MPALPTWASGVFLNPRESEDIVIAVRDGSAALVAGERPEELFAPPVIARSIVEQAGYVRSFPNLLGTISSFAGDQREWRSLVDDGNWYQDQRMSDVVLLPATCHHIYPTLASAELTGPRTFLVHGQCFRQEASAEPGRLRSFRMTELVRVGGADDCDAWRLAWLDRVADWLGVLGLDVRIVPASDPFFGPADRLLRSSQLEQQLKWELQVPVTDGVRQAVASSNYHQDHFGTAFAISHLGEHAHTACVAFGLERIALALVLVNGPRVEAWPAAARAALAGLPDATNDNGGRAR